MEITRQEIAEILGVFQDFLTQLAAILAAKMCVAPIGSASKFTCTSCRRIFRLICVKNLGICQDSRGFLPCQMKNSAGSPHPLIDSALPLSQTQVQILVLLRRVLPGQVLFHIPQNHFIPIPALIEIKRLCSVDGVQQQAGVVMIEGKAVS